MLNDDSHSILIVDDVAVNLNLLTGLLKSRGYKVRPAPSGRLALEAARHDPPDLVLLDIHMPEMNGYEVCRRFKQDEILQEIPVLFISALTETKDLVKAFEAGGVDYITKPFQVEEVLARVRTHLDLIRYRKTLQKQNITLQKTIDRLNSARAQLVRSEKMAAIGTLVAGVAHEINNPINFIKSGILGLKRDIEDLVELTETCSNLSRAGGEVDVKKTIEELHERIGYKDLLVEVETLFGNVLEGVRRTEEIVKSLLTFSRRDDAKTELAPIHELIDSALTILKNRYKNTVKIERQYGEAPPVPCHVGKISQMMVNILANSIDAVESRADDRDNLIVIRTGVTEQMSHQYVRIDISDTGPGIPEDIREKIFDPFFTTKDVGKGTGLGLYISQGIAQDHKGYIEVTSSPEVGTTFSIFLPAIREEG